VTASVDVDPRTDGGWCELVRRAGGSLFHSPPWAAALADTYGWSPRARMVLDATGTAVAGIPWCVVGDGAEARVVSLPFSDFCGPVGAETHHGALLASLGHAGLPVRWRVVCDPDAPTSPEAVGTARWHGIPVVQEPDVAWDRLSASTRRAVAKARRDGVTVTSTTDAAFTARFLRLHTGVRKRKYRLLPQPLTFFDALRTRFDAIDGWHPLVAVQNDDVVAATIFLRWGDTLYYKFNASDPDTLGSRPNDLLLWAGIELAAALGCRQLDLGASDDDQPGLCRFKRGFGAEEREIRTFASGPPPSPTAQHLDAILRELTERFTDPSVPDAVTEQAGAVLYRYFA
jgi:CelD/BcsL family acetyltransferase involved in cellulose biosynthesis